MITNTICGRCGERPAQFFGKTKLKKHYCLECKRAYAVAWSKVNPDNVRESQKKTRDKYKEELKIKRKEQRWNLKIDILTHYSGGKPQCKCCGEQYPEFLAVDHINNNGAEAKKNGEPKGGIGFYTYLRKNNYPEGFQILCHNCNMAKAFYGQCPHHKDVVQTVTA